MDRSGLNRIARGETARWAAALGLFSPMILIYVLHFVTAPAGLWPTGFLQYDQFYYMAIAREHFDGGTFTLFYGLPFSPDPETPRLYLQPFLLVLGILHHLSALDPGRLYVGFGVISGIAFARVAIVLYEQLIGLGDRTRRLGVVMFFWGGGLLALFGLLHGSVTGGSLLESLTRFDPFEGLWFLNLGRNVYYGTEAFYHLLFLGTVLLLFRRRYGWALAAAALLAASHPFSGTQLLVILLLWAALESLLVRADRRPVRAFLAATVALAAAHFFYYLGVLPTSAEHRALLSQWKVDWSLPAASALLAYGPVSLAAIWRIRSGTRFRAVFADPRNRFLAVWALVSLALANHELVLPAHQPLHFTRGYIWTPIFLLAAPVVVGILERIRARATPAARVVLLAGIVTLAVFDNATWFGKQMERALQPRGSLGIAIPRDLHDILQSLDRPALSHALLVSHNDLIEYFATVYTPLRTWNSHYANTPYRTRRQAEINLFFNQLTEPEEWRRREMFVLVTRKIGAGWLEQAHAKGFQMLREGTGFILLHRPPRAASNS